MDSQEFGYSDMIFAWVFMAVTFAGGFGLGAVLTLMKGFKTK